MFVTISTLAIHIYILPSSQCHIYPLVLAKAALMLAALAGMAPTRSK